MGQDRNDKKNISGAQFTQPPDDFQVNSPTGIVGFDFDDVRPWAAQYVDLQDRLFVTVVAGSVGGNVNVVVRMLRPDGTIVLLPFLAPAGAAGVAVTTPFPLMEGFILCVSVQGAGQALLQNPLFASVALVRQQATAALQSCTLCAGYVNNSTGFGYPEHPPQRMTDGPGGIMRMSLGAPGAGVDNIFTIPVGMRMRIVSLSFVLTTAVAAGTRNIEVRLDDGANVYAALAQPTGQNPSTAVIYTFADSVPFQGTVNTNGAAPLPSNLIMPAGHRIRTVTGGIQAADQLSNLSALVHVWLDAV